jgi:hypothetical protein
MGHGYRRYGSDADFVAALANRNAPSIRVHEKAEREKGIKGKLKAVRSISFDFFLCPTPFHLYPFRFTL